MHRIRYAIRRLPRPLDWLASLILISFVGCATVLFFTAYFGSRLFLTPFDSRLADAFFQEPFVLFVITMIAWFLSSVRSRPDRLDELRYLRSLPLGSARISRNIIVHDIHAFAWVPGVIAALLFYLNKVSPLALQVRLFALAFSFFVVVIALNIVIQLARALRKTRTTKYIWPVQTNPFIQILLIFLLALSFTIMISRPFLASGFSFWVIFCGALASCYILTILTEHLFDKWQQGNLVFLSDPVGREQKNQSIDIFRFLNGIPTLSPFLQKSIVKYAREKNLLSLFLTFSFVTSLYWMAMNNEVKDGLAVLFAISCLFALTVAARCIQQLSPEEESPDWVFSLPLKKGDLYLSIFLPGIARMGFVIISMTALGALFSRATMISLITFLAKAQLVTMIMLGVACSYAIYHYPVVETAKRQFLKWVLVTIVLGALLYKYIYVVMVVMSIWPFIQLRRLKLFRTG